MPTEKNKDIKHREHGHSNFSNVHDDVNHISTNHQNIKSDDLGQKNADLEKQVIELKDALVRSLADAENLKKRHVKDLEATAKYSTTALLKDIIDPFEQLFIALGIEIPEDLSQHVVFKSVFDGIDMTRQLFEKALTKHGLIRIYPKDEQFNHDNHQAISQMKQDGAKTGTILQVVQAGYTLNGRIVKPALVIVAE